MGLFSTFQEEGTLFEWSLQIVQMNALANPGVSNTRPAWGPQYAFVRPVNILETDKSINFDQILLMFNKFILF
jgi:hypothetical protein